MKQLVEDDEFWHEFWHDFVSRYASLSNEEAGKRDRVLRLLMKLTVECGILPLSLYALGITMDYVHYTYQGGYAHIYKGKYAGRLVALKRLKKFDDFDRARRDLYREVLIWWRLQHPNILPLLSINSDVFKGAEAGTDICMVLPWVSHGTIMGCALQLENAGLPLPTDRWLSEIAQGLTYLHGKEVVHGDLKGSNILIDLGQRTNLLTIRLTDFSLSAFASTVNSSAHVFHGGTAPWMAPELHQGITEFREAFPADIYAFACTVIEFYSNHAPFKGEPDMRTSQDMIYAIIDGRRPLCPQGPRHMPDEVWDLVQRCWEGTPGLRPKAEKVSEELEARLRLPGALL